MFAFGLPIIKESVVFTRLGSLSPAGSYTSRNQTLPHGAVLHARRFISIKRSHRKHEVF
jgi:hypothetical protein